uniref:KASH domain-containing protein n=1 Tax=Phlebotomus papatasi TaxID=29031 RepID=A0A1B0DC93_PHLPP
MRQMELKKYSQLQQEIENWLASIKIPSAKADQELNVLEGVQEIVVDQQKLIDDITCKEQKLQEIRDKCQEMQKQQHVKKLATTLTEQFTIILTLLETRKQSTLNYIGMLKAKEDELMKGKKDDDRDTLESMSMPEEEPDVQKMTIETQTSVREEKIVDDETQTSFPLLDPGQKDTQTAFVQTQVERRPTDNITVLHMADEEKETIEIDNQLNLPILKDERPSDVLVEAKFNQSQPGSSSRTSELVLRNVPQSFETTFVEPDETTTEVVVDADGTKRIIVRKVKRTRLQREIVMQSVTVGAEQIPQVQEETIIEEIPVIPGQEAQEVTLKGVPIREGDVTYVDREHLERLPTPEPLARKPGYETSTVRAIVQHVTRKVIRKTRKIIKRVTIVDGKEHVTEEVVEEPEEVEISEEDIPNININLTSGDLPGQEVSGDVEEKDEVTYEIVKTVSGKEGGEEESAALEIKEKVREIAPVEEEDATEARSEPMAEEIPAQKELILTDVKEIWPKTATIDEIPVHLLDTVSMGDDDTVEKAIDHTTADIWPTNPNIGADVDLQRYGVSVTEVEHVIETIEKDPEEKSVEIAEKSEIEELKAKAEVVEAEVRPVDEVQEERGPSKPFPAEASPPSPSEPSTPGEAPKEPEEVSVQEEREPAEPPSPSKPSTPGETPKEPEEIHPSEEEAERTRIKVTLPSLISSAESSLTVNLKMEPSEHTKVNVNLTEEISLTPAPEVPQPESPKIPTPEKIVLEVYERVSGSDDQEVRQTGYEAEDITVDDAGEESRKSKRKKKRKQKIKAKEDEPTEVPKATEETQEPKEPKEPKEPTIQEGVEKEITPDESYASISEYEADSVRIMEESVIKSPSPDDLQPMPSELVTAVPVIDTMYVEESEQQTSLPYEEATREEVVPHESPQKEAVIQEEHSVQTSPTHQPTMEISQQTSPEPETEQQETEAQTIVIESTEVEIQTTPIKLADEEPSAEVLLPKPEVSSEEIQTEPVAFEEKTEPVAPIETTDSTSQTIVLDTREQYLQTSPVESPEHHPRESMVNPEEDVNRIAATIVDEIVRAIPTPTATQETNTESVTIQEATMQTSPEPIIQATAAPEEDSSLSTTTSEPYEIQVEASLVYPQGGQMQKIPENFSVEVTRSFDLDDRDAPRSYHEILEIPSGEASSKPKTVTISMIKKTVVDELFDQPDPEEEQKKVERLLEGRLKMSQEARSSPLSNVLHLATLEESQTEEPAQERLEALQGNLLELEDAIQRQDPVVIQRTVTIIFEKISIWLETIEYRVYVTRQSATSGPTEKKIGEFNELRNELECIQGYVEHLRRDLEQPMEDVEGENMVQCVNVIVDHLRAIDNVTQSSEQQVQEDFRRFSDYQMNVDELQLNIQQLKSNLDRIVSEEMGLDRKLQLLDEFDDINRAFGKEVQRLIHVARGLERDFPEKETPEQIFMCREMVSNLDGNINMERNRLNQLVNLAQEYEQTLNEFAKIILIADSLVESQITTTNLDNLQNEIQKHRKFFVNLSHCRAILESLEMNLDPVTREKHTQLHQNLHESATIILDKASDRAQRLSMAASRWTVLERGMKEEKQWLQIAQQRIPDLSDVTSTDYDQYINMYQSLSADIAHHHAKLVQLTTTAVKLQELVSASNVEDDCNEQLFMILKLKEDVALHLKKLLKFRQYWILYETTTDKIEQWITTSEHHLEKIEIPKLFRDYPLEHMRLFWDIKAEFELYNSIKNDASGNLSRALEVVPIADELLQKEFHERLESKWMSVEDKIQKIQKSIVDSMSASNVPTNEKLQLLQKELEELEKSMAGIKGIIKNQDELQLYIERMQILNSRVVIVGTELGRIGLTSSSDSERIGRLFGVSHRISMQISEELDGALVLQDQLNKISHGIIRMRLLQQSSGETLDQCEAIELSGSEIVENALYDCQRVHNDLKSHWQGIMELRQLLHTLPMRLKISVSPVMLERDISQLQDEHVLLESRCEKILNALRGALHLWKTFERQLEQVQQSIQQTDYMVELLKVHGQVDYERLVKATERLQTLHGIHVFSFVKFQGLHGDLDSNEDLLEDLKCSAEPLIEICSTEVAHKIEVAVQETIQAWNETSQNLTDLCNKYQRAVRLWQQYRDATEALINWVDEKEGNLKIMDPNGELQYIKVRLIINSFIF